MPVAYQGGKQRLAPTLLDLMQVGASSTRFYDLCCGSGAVTLALLERGHFPEQIVMVERGPFGLVWAALCGGSFDLPLFRTYCDAVPEDPALVRRHVLDLAARPADLDTPYVFLLLQAASFGSKAVWIENGGWRHHGFRDYWLPTATSNRRSPVNPMMPMPRTLYTRLAALTPRMRGVTAICADAARVEVETGAVVYIDPPYGGTTEYGFALDAVALAQRLGNCWVSEARALSPQAHCLSTGRAKGGISGGRKAVNEEWLSYFPRRTA